MKINSIQIDTLSTNNPFVSSFWAKLKNVNCWDSKAYSLITDKNIFQSLVLFKKLFLNLYFVYIPFSPICINGKSILDEKLIKEFLDFVISDSEKKIAFIKIDLPFEYDSKQKFHKPFKYNKYSIQPEATIVIDLRNNVEDLRKKYKKRAIRNLRKNIDQLVIKEVVFNEVNIKSWYQIYLETAKRDNFSSRDISYFLKMKNIEDSIKPRLIFAYDVNENLIGGNIILINNENAVYLFGASKRNHNLSPSYGLQDFSIKMLKNEGVKSYDLFGVGVDEKSDNLKSLTQFKSSFGGNVLTRIPTLDYPNKRFIYSLYKIVERVRFFIYR
ncbi:MAG: peptidoglycan bridge formation glycyltransferase FemA/FemB family protein [Spirochaetia bacterium]|nr:peptidoglycan bridge formation glycyltransferase FemA/FemB family protein [Spirochaetia bacterium]